jgi:hypothetical protein
MKPSISIFLKAMKEAEEKSFHAPYTEFPAILPDKKQLEKLKKSVKILLSRWEFYESCIYAEKHGKKD